MIMQYSWFNDFSGQIAFEGWSMSYYNVIFTILPPLVIGIFDQYVSARMLDRYPQLYQLGQQNYFFTPQTFFYWVGNAFYHSVVSTCTPCPIRMGRSSFRSSSFAPTRSISGMSLPTMARLLVFGFGAQRSISVFSSLCWAKLL